jgi:hypothetical protein
MENPPLLTYLSISPAFGCTSSVNSLLCMDRAVPTVRLRVMVVKLLEPSSTQYRGEAVACVLELSGKVVGGILHCAIVLQWTDDLCYPRQVVRSNRFYLVSMSNINQQEHGIPTSHYGYGGQTARNSDAIRAASQTRTT